MLSFPLRPIAAGSAVFKPRMWRLNLFVSASGFVESYDYATDLGCGGHAPERRLSNLNHRERSLG
jgi:hypothetical protein